MSNQSYSNAVDKLIPIAFAHANQQIQPNAYLNKDEYKIAHTKTFFRKMDALKKLKGLGYFAKYKAIPKFAIGINPHYLRSTLAVYDCHFETLKIYTRKFSSVIQYLQEKKSHDCLVNVYLHKIPHAKTETPSTEYALHKITIDFCQQLRIPITTTKKPPAGDGVSKTQFKMDTPFKKPTTQTQRNIAWMVWGK